MSTIKAIFKHPATWAVLGVIAGAIVERKIGLITKVGLGTVIMPSA